MACTGQFQALADAVQSRDEGVSPDQVAALMASGAVALDIRDKEEPCQVPAIPDCLSVFFDPIWTKQNA
jgi:hypothetical protein